MSSNEQLESLLLRWEELAEAGAPVDAAALCRECPELRPELEERIALLQKLDWLKRRGAGAATNGAASKEPQLGAGVEPIPGYRLVKRLGRGGFGEVWQADGAGGFAVALKFIPRGGQAYPVEERALGIIKDLRHPHLLTVFGTWQTDEFLILAMELAECTLLEHCQNPLPRAELLRLLLEAAEALDHLNLDRRIQHCDVKPQNLLLSGGSVKVSDFGLARVVAHSTTGQTGGFTLAYAAPEFFHGKATPTSDQYSLAVTYCHLRGGRLPFIGTAAELTHGHLRRSPDLSMLPPKERPAVGRALAKSPRERWPSCQAFLEAVAAEQRPPLTRRQLVRLGAVVMGVSLLGTAGACALYVRSKSPRRLRELIIPDWDTTRGQIRGVSSRWHPRKGEDRFVAVSNGAMGAIQWDLNTGEMVRQLTRLQGVAIALPDLEEPWCITTGENGEVIQWDLDSGAEIRRFVGHRASVGAVAVSPDHQQVLTGGTDNTIRLWERKTGVNVRTITGHTKYVQGVAFDPTGRRCISASFDGTVRIWDLESGQELKRLEGHTAAVWCVAVRGNGQQILSGGDDGTARLWDDETGQVRLRIETGARHVSCVAFLPQRDLFAVCSEEMPTRFWNLSTLEEMPFTLPKAEWIDAPTSNRPVVLARGDRLELWQLPE